MAATVWSCRQHFHSHLSGFWGGDIFFNYGDYFGATILSDGNSLVSHGRDPLAGMILTAGAILALATPKT